MAQDSSNQASLCKCLASILFLTFISCVSSEEFYIVPSPSYPCSEDHCLTLSQFVSAFTNCSNCDSTILIFVPGNYNLESDLIIENIHSFSISTEPLSSALRIICNIDTNFEFRNITIVAINGVDFIECYGNLLASVSGFNLTESTFYSHPEHDSTTLTITESTAYLERVAFLSTVESVQDRTITTLKLQENCTLNSTTIYRILANNSVIIIKESLFDRTIVGVGAVVSDLDSSKITIFNNTFANNRATCCSSETCVGAILRVSDGTIAVYDSRFEYNHGTVSETVGGIATFSHCVFSNHFQSFHDDIIDDDVPVENVFLAFDSDLSIRYSMFINNTVPIVNATSSNTFVTHNTFGNNNRQVLMFFTHANVTSLYHNELVNNTAINLIKHISTDNVAISLNEFISNKVVFGLISLSYDIEPENVTNNIFIDNSAAFDIYINSDCMPGLSRSLGSSRCITCPKRWYLNFAGLLVAAFVAGIVFVVLMLALNLTVAVGTLNGILFYANIVAAIRDAYFPLSSTPNFATVIISWLNLDIGFDVCAYEGMTIAAKVVLQLVFPAYVVVLVIVIIIVGEYSSKFAKIVGKGNPVAVLATMILISFTKLLKAVIGSITLLYVQPAYGSRNVDPTNLYASNPGFTATGKALLVISPLVGVLCLLYTALVFFWKWLVRYQNKIIFRWVRYQKLHHFMEPYHAPYETDYRYWTGLLLIIRIILFSVSAINFSRDPRVDFVSTVFVVGCLILFKGVVAKRIYKNVLIDVMETVIYFNLVFIAAFTWYSLDFGGNQVAVAYISVVIIFALLLAVIVYHLVRFTCLYKLSFGKKSLQGITNELAEKNQVQENEEELDEVDGVLMQRAKPKYVSYSVVAMSQNNARP